jgi:hypothetical protein
MKMYIINTNVNGCVTGNYYSEVFNTLEEAQKVLEVVKQGDNNAKILEVK